MSFRSFYTIATKFDTDSSLWLLECVKGGVDMIAKMEYNINKYLKYIVEKMESYVARSEKFMRGGGSFVECEGSFTSNAP